MFRRVPVSIITEHTVIVYVIQLASRIRKELLSAKLYDIYHCCVYSEKLLTMYRETVRNM